MDFDKLFPGRFIKAADLAGKDATLTISAVVVEELEGDKGKQMKGIVSFKETKKQLVINKTNALCVRAMFGRETNNWLGKRVTFFPARIEFGDSEFAIRVRGSPDIPAPLTFELKLPRKKGKSVTLAKTAPRQNGKPAPQPAPAPAPTPAPVPEGFDPATGSAPISDEEAASILAQENALAGQDL